MLLIWFIIYSKTIPNCVLAKIQSHLIGILLRQFQTFSQPNFICISSEFFQDLSKICCSQNSIASHRSYYLFSDISKLCLRKNSTASHRISSNTIPNFVSAKFQLHLIGIFLKTNQNSVSGKIQLLLIGFIIYSKTIPNCVLAKIQSHLIGIFLRQFQNLSVQKFNCFSSVFLFFPRHFQTDS